jgi:hypothetical protein
MSSTITVKVVYNADIRRFCLPETISFSEFIINIGKLFKLDQLTIKYVDDEGDSIVVTSDEELQEALRLAKELKPPILRVTVQAVASAPVAGRSFDEEARRRKRAERFGVRVQGSHTESEPAAAPPPACLLESSQYPPLDVAFWDAPAKSPVVLAPAVPVPVPVLPEEPQPIRIAQQMTDHCMATSRSVSQCSRDTTTDMLKYSDSTRLQLNDSGLVNSTVALCSDLSRQIAEDCRLLSLQTSEISRQLAAERKADLLNNPYFKYNIEYVACLHALVLLLESPLVFSLTRFLSLPSPVR